MSDDDLQSCPPDPTRRKFLLTTGTSVAASLAAAYVPVLANSAPGESEPAPPGARPTVEGAVPITLRINGKDHQLRIDPRTTCWIVFVRLLHSLERRKVVTMVSAAHVQCM